MGRFLAALLLIAAQAPAGPAAVASVRLEGHRPAWGLEALLTVRTGEPMDPLEVHRSVQNLYETGRIEQVEVVEEAAGDGIGLVFRVFPFPEIRETKARCRGCPQPPIILPGTPCTPELLDKVEGSIAGRLVQEGYLHAHLKASCGGSLLVVEGERGPRTVIAEVAVTADGEGRALESLRTLKGKPYRRDKVAARLAAVEKRLLKAHPQAGLRLVEAEETPEGMVLRIEATGLAPVEYAAAGDAGARDVAWARRALQGEPLTAGFLAQRSDELAERYQAQGYANASAEIRAEETGAGKRVVVGLTLGRRFLLEGVRLEGIPADEGADLLALLPAAGGRPYAAEESREWKDAILSGLLGEGYLDATVKGPDARLDASAGTAGLVFRIDRGLRYIPGTVEVLGLPEDLPSPALAVHAGEPLTPDRVQADLEALQAALDGAGFVDARVGVQKEAGRLAYAVEPGPRVLVDRLIFRGLWFTRRDRIQPEVTLRPGRPVSFSKVLDTQSRLYGTGLFSSVEVRTLTEPEAPERATVILEVEEDAPRSYTYGLGYDTYDGARVQGGLYHNNLFGTRRAVGVEGRYSGKEQQWRLFYREPSFFFIPHPIQVSVFQSFEQRPDFTLDKWGTTVELARALGARTRAILRYAYEIQDASDITEGYPVPREDADKKVSSLGVGYLHDARDDPFYPTAGRLFSLNLRYAFPLRNATSHFIQGDLRGTGYLSPVRGGTLAFSARGGVIANRLDDEEVPLGERFFLGGRDTVRAFSRDAVGVDGETVVAGSPVGGNAFLLLNVEWRQRLTSWAGLSVFVDSGQVWRERGGTDLGDLRAGTGYGVGVFFFSPLGPIRAEYSRKLEPNSWDDRDQWYLGIGVPF